MRKYLRQRFNVQIKYVHSASESLHTHTHIRYININDATLPFEMFIQCTYIIVIFTCTFPVHWAAFSFNHIFYNSVGIYHNIISVLCCTCALLYYYFPYFISFLFLIKRKICLRSLYLKVRWTTGTISKYAYNGLKRSIQKTQHYEYPI